MEEIPDMNLCSSPNINSVLKPPKPRIPLKDIMSAVNDDDNTASRKRRVSFANVNKIKEFSAGAESMVVCHTPAYEEPFSVSSDSSCPGVEGVTPAKFNPVTHPKDTSAMFYYEQKEDSVDKNIDHRTSLSQSQFSLQSNSLHKSARLSVSKLQMPGIFPQSNNVTYSSLCGNSQLDEMDLTSCNNIERGTLRNLSMLSLGMDSTSVAEQSMRNTRYSSEGMDLTTAANSHQLFTDQRLSYVTDTNLIDDEDLENSDSLELTDAINEPKLAPMSTMYSVHDMDLTGNVNSVNNTRYSVKDIDLTKAGISRRPSCGRRSTRYSVSNMDLTEALGNNSALDVTKVIDEPRIVTMSTRYSVNEMDLTESVTNKDYNRFSTNTMNFTDVGDKLEYSADSETSMDFTKPIYNIYQSTYDKESLLRNSSKELNGMVEELRSRKSTCYIADMDLTETNITLRNDESCNKSDILSSEINIENNKNESKLKITGKELQYLSDCEVTLKQASGQMMDLMLESTKHTKVNDNVLEENNTNMFSKSCNMDLTTAVSEKNKSSEKDVRSKENKMQLFDRKKCGKDKMIITDNMSKHTETDSCSNKGENKNVAPMIQDNILGIQQIINVENEIINLSESRVPNSVHNSRKSVHSEDAEMLLCTESKEEASEINMSVSLPDENDLKKDATIKNDLVLKQKQTYLHVTDISNLNSENTSTLHNKTDLQSKSDDMNVSVGVDTKNDIKEEMCEIVDSERYDNVGSEIHENVHYGICDIDDNERYENVIEIENNSFKSNEASEVANVKYSCAANVLKQEFIHEQVNDTLSVEECERHELISELIQDNIIVKDVELLQVSSETLMNNSTNDTICSKNITMSRGGGRDCNTTFTVPRELPLEKNIDRTMVHNNGQINKLKYLPLNQDVETDNDTVNVSETPADGLQVAYSTSCMLEKVPGGKRSFEIALEPENDSEESPVKQVCLSKTEYLADTELLHDVTAPSFLMDPLNAPNETIPSVHNSSMASTAGKINSPTQNELDNELTVGKELSENKELKNINVSCVEEREYFDGSVRSFSLRADVSAQFENENFNHPLREEEIHHVSVQIKNTQINPGCTAIQLKDQNRIINHNQEPAKLISDSSFEYEHILGSADDTIPQSSFSLPSPIKGSLFDFNQVEKVNSETKNSLLCNSEKSPKVTLDKKNCSNIIVSDDVTRRLTTLFMKHNILSKTKTVRNLEGGMFACDLIPKWIDLQFCIDSNDIITNIDFKVACSEKYQAVGKYLLQQVRSSVLPGLASDDLLLQLQGCLDKFHFLEHLARNLCVICKYHNGTLKGNVLTVEVISCRKQLWIFVDINMKYPQDLRATDIIISEQKFGAFKLSSIRQIFESIQRNQDQLINFTQSLMKL